MRIPTARAMTCRIPLLLLLVGIAACSTDVAPVPEVESEGTLVERARGIHERVINP